MREAIKTGIGEIEVEYKVRWRGHTPKGCIFYRDPEIMQFRDVFVFPEIKIGYRGEPANSQFTVVRLSELTFQQGAVPYSPIRKDEAKFPLEEIERRLIETTKREKATLIRVGRQEDIEPVADAYCELYVKQFRDLHERIWHLFRGFIAQYPDLGFPNVNLDTETR